MGHTMGSYAKAAVVALVIVFIANRTAMGLKYLGPKALAPAA